MNRVDRNHLYSILNETVEQMANNHEREQLDEMTQNPFMSRVCRYQSIIKCAM